MSTIMALSHSLPPLDSLPRPHSRLAAKYAPNLPKSIPALKHLMLCVALSAGKLRVLAGAAGDLKENYDGTHWLKPKEINEGNFSKMLYGHFPIPDWRMGQMVAICEYVAVLRMIEIEDGGPRAKPYQELLKSFPRRFGWFMDQPQFCEWIKRFRYAIFNRVKMDRTKSPTDARFYRAYNEYLKTVDGQGETSQAMEQAKANNEVQAS